MRNALIYDSELLIVLLLKHFSDYLCVLVKIKCVNINTYDTGLVIVSLNATLGFPITQAQLYSLSIL